MSTYARHDFTVVANEQVQLDFDVSGYTFGGNTAVLTIRRNGGGVFAKDLTISTNTVTATIARNEASDSPGELRYDELGVGRHSYSIAVKAALGRVMWQIQGEWIVNPPEGIAESPSSRLTDVTITLDGSNVAQVAIGTTPVSFGIPAGDNGQVQYNDTDMFGATSQFVFAKASGAIAIGSNATDTTTKSAALSGLHYTNAEQNLSVFHSSSQASTSVITIGGGSGSFNAATSVMFYTAANNTTTTGTVAMSVDAAQNVRIGTGAAATRLDVDGAIAIKDSDTAPSTASGKLTLYVDSTSTHLTCKYGDGTTHILDQKAGALVLIDGITAPSTLSGSGLIYIDTADGDLKIKYGDGTVKTIVVDT